MADLYIIGQYGAVSDTTAVSIGSQVMHMLTVMIVGLAMGATVFIGQSIGADDKKKAAKGIGNTITIFMMASVVLTTILVAFVKPVTRLMSTPADAVLGTIDYLTICFIGIPFITAYNVISAAFLAAGFGCIVALVIQFWAEPVVSLFTDVTTAEGAEVVRLGGQYLRGYVWDCIFAGVHFCFSGYFGAIGKSGIISVVICVTAFTILMKKNRQNETGGGGKVGVGISIENLKKGCFDSYDGIFLILDEGVYCRA